VRAPTVLPPSPFLDDEDDAASGLPARAFDGVTRVPWLVTVILVLA
jgi:hypothetical protein